MAGVPTRPCHAVSACRRLQGAYVRHLWCQMTLARRPGRTRGHMVRPRSGTYPWPTKHGLTPPLTPTTPSTGRFFGHNDVALWEQLMWRSPVRPPALGWPPALGGRAVHTPVVPGGCALTESLHTRYDKVTHRRYAGKRGRLAARSTGGVSRHGSRPSCALSHALIVSFSVAPALPHAPVGSSPRSPSRPWRPWRVDMRT